ncbi:MAG: hypothetical protein AB7K85_02230 [Novosphingobium sp.]|jgi:hypothetical protein
MAAIALVAGAYYLWRKGAPAARVLLMLLLAAIMAVNVAIWTLPDATGDAPVDRVLQ